MNEWLAFLASVIVATGIAVSIVLISRKSLARLLAEVCGDAARAEYWTVFAGSFLVLCTLYGTLAAVPANTSIAIEEAPYLAAVSTLRAGVLGLLVASMCIAFVLLRFIARFEDRARRKPSWMEAREPASDIPPKIA
jgi:hypothetical protein